MRMRSSKQPALYLIWPLAAGAILAGCGGGGGGGGGSSTSTTTGTGIVYAANEIVYGVPSASAATFNLYEVKPDGTANSALASNLSASILLFTQIPSQSNNFVIAAQVGTQSSFGIYISAGLSISAVTTLVPAIYEQVTSLSITGDGKNVVYSATLASDPTQTSYLFAVPTAGGSPVQLDYSDGSTISPGDNNTVAYVASPGGNANFDQVFTRSLSAGASGKATQLTTDAINHILPAFNRTGTQLAYWESSTTNTLMLQTVGSSVSPLALPNPNQIVPQGESFNADGTQLVIAADANGSGELLTQNTSQGSNPSVILLNSQLMGNYGIYWTNANGKRLLLSSIMPSAARRRTGLPFFLHGGR